jgi:hypothetical protein
MCQPAVVCSAGDARHDCFVMGLFLIHWSSHCELRFAIVGCLFLTTLHLRVSFFAVVSSLNFVSCICANMHRRIASVD